MSVFSYSKTIINKRPSTLIIFSIFTLLACAAYELMPVFRIFYRLAGIFKGNILKSVVSMIQLVFQPSMLLLAIPYVIGGVVLASLVGAVISSIYFNIFNNAVLQKPKIGGEFFKGLSQYFFRIYVIILISLTVFVLFMSLAAIASIPAVAMTTSAGVKAGAIPGAVILDILTIVSLYLVFTFLRVYSFYWFSAVFNIESGVFSTGKRAADLNFWKIVRGIGLFDLIFVLYVWIFRFIDIAPIKFLGSWIFLTSFFFLFFSYIFVTFHKSLSSLKTKGTLLN